jgi:aminopeptidase-like protein
MKGLIERLLLKNRTIVSRDDRECMEILREQWPIMVHEFASGTDYQTWPVPPEWNLRSGSVRDHADRVIASTDESSLFVAPYSMPFSGSVTRDELIAHTLSNPARPDAYCYEHRIAADARRRLAEWRITMPHERLQALGDGPFRVEIDVETRSGHLLIAELAHPGRSGHWFTLLSHYCHPAQANDGLAGVAVMLEALDRIKRKHPTPKHGYKTLVMPETFGSSIYAATHEAELDATLGAVFSEMAGADAPLQFKWSRRADTYIDRVFVQVLRQRGVWPCRTVEFRNGWGNDELVFDAPGVGVPAVSVDRHPFAAYHTHHDNMSLIIEAKLEEVVEIIVAVADVIERDYIPHPQQRVPVYLTRYGLYADWTYDRSRYDLNILLVESMWSGLSVLDIALTHGLDVDTVYDYIDRFVALGLVTAAPVTPAYTRTTRKPVTPGEPS